MATIAQIATQRRKQVSVVRQVYRVADTAGEVLERKLKTYANKKKLIEARDMQPLVTLFRDYVSKVSQIEKALTNLVTLVGS